MALPDKTSLIAGTVRSTGISTQDVGHQAEFTGSTINNDTNLDEVLDLEIVYQYGTAPTANRTVEVYILYAMDGTNFTTREDGGILIRAFSPPAATGIRRIPVGDFPLLPYPFKLHVRNVDTNQTINITLNARTRKAVQIID